MSQYKVKNTIKTLALCTMPLLGQVTAMADELSVTKEDIYQAVSDRLDKEVDTKTLEDLLLDVVSQTDLPDDDVLHLLSLIKTDLENLANGQGSKELKNLLMKLQERVPKDLPEEFSVGVKDTADTKFESESKDATTLNNNENKQVSENDQNQGQRKEDTSTSQDTLPKEKINGLVNDRVSAEDQTNSETPDSPLKTVESLKEKETLPDIDLGHQMQQVYTTKKAINKGEGTYYYDKNKVKGTLVTLTEDEAKKKGLSLSLLEDRKETSQTSKQETPGKTKTLTETNTSAFISSSDWSNQGGVYYYASVDAGDNPTAVTESEAKKRGFIKASNAHESDKKEHVTDQNTELNPATNNTQTASLAPTSPLTPQKDNSQTPGGGGAGPSNNTVTPQSTTVSQSSTEKQTNLPHTGDEKNVLSVFGSALLGLILIYRKKHRDNIS